MSFTVRIAREDDGPGICRLFSRVFPREMGLEEWRWKYPRNPDGWLSVVAEVEGSVAGHYGGCGSRVLIGGEELITYSLCDLATDPSKRRIGGPHAMFLGMAETWNAMLRDRGIPFAFGFPGPEAFGAGAKRVGYRSHYPVRELRFEIPANRVVVGAGAQFVESSFDRLWQDARSLIAASGFVRDFAHFDWRFRARPDRRYQTVWVETPEGDGLAWGALSLSGDVALVMDYLARDGSRATFGRLWDGLQREASRLGASTLVFWEPSGGPWRQHLLARMNLPGASSFEPGYALATAAIFEEASFATFLRNLHFTPSCYDDR